MLGNTIYSLLSMCSFKAENIVANYDMIAPEVFMEATRVIISERYNAILNALRSGWEDSDRL
jgi:hypothetical protein